LIKYNISHPQDFSNVLHVIFPFAGSSYSGFSNFNAKGHGSKVNDRNLQ